MGVVCAKDRSVSSLKYQSVHYLCSWTWHNSFCATISHFQVMLVAFRYATKQGALWSDRFSNDACQYHFSHGLAVVYVGAGAMQPGAVGSFAVVVVVIMNSSRQIGPPYVL